MRDVPKQLNRVVDYQTQWSSPDLLLGQACGYDVYCANDHALQIVGAPCYRFTGCSGANYRSFILVKKSASHGNISDLRDTRCVINSPRSHSGMNVLQSMVAPLAKDGTFFGSIQISGAHERSVQMIADGTADVAAIDCITYGLLESHRPEMLRQTRILCHSPAQTAPPYVTCAKTSQAGIAVLLVALQEALNQLDPVIRDALGLLGIQGATRTDYAGIGILKDDAERRYSEMSQPKVQH